MKVVVDTSVLLSAVLRDRLPEQVVLHIVAHEEWIWLATDDILQEYVHLISRSRWRMAGQETQHGGILRSRRLLRQSLPNGENRCRAGAGNRRLGLPVATAHGVCLLLTTT
jgi:predicted nucleic acid-binding protein